MSERSDTDNEPNGSGCFLIVGVIAIPIAVGNIWSAGYGWLVLGVLCLTMGLIASVRR